MKCATVVFAPWRIEGTNNHVVDKGSLMIDDWTELKSHYEKDGWGVRPSGAMGRWQVIQPDGLAVRKFWKNDKLEEAIAYAETAMEEAAKEAYRAGALAYLQKARETEDKRVINPHFLGTKERRSWGEGYGWASGRLRPALDAFNEAIDKVTEEINEIG